jgi:hypothetical protein
MIKNAVDNPKLKAETFKARFLEAGVVQYADEMVLIRPENLMTIALKFKGAKVIIDHKEVDASNASEIVGYINNVWEENGWAWCDFTVNDEEAIDLINKGYSVSCAYLPVATGSGGTKNAVLYDREIVDIVEDDEVTHLAIVESPRYEDAIILKNSIKKKVMNIFKLTSKKEAKQNSVKEIELESAAFEIDGKEVPISSLMKAYKNAEDEKEKKENEEEEKKEAKVNADDEFEVDGKMVKVSEMAKAFKAAKKNEEDEEKKNAEEEEEKKNEEEEDKKENEEDEEEKKKEAKKNSADFRKISKAKAKFENGAEISRSKIITDSERFALGRAAYGEPQKITN